VRYSQSNLSDASILAEEVVQLQQQASKEGCHACIEL
jgi:hypothetical protein